MKDNSNDARPTDSASPKRGWNLFILAPEESERLIREEPRLSFDAMLDDLYRQLAAEPPPACR